MSRIGRKAIVLPKGTSVTIKGDKVVVKGTKGELNTPLMPGIAVDVSDDRVVVSRSNDEKQTCAWHGMTRALIANMVTGVTEGFQKTMEIVGVGWRAQLQGKKLVMNLGFSHPVEFTPPQGVEIREYRPPEPYHGKGIRFQDEHIVRKAGKTGAK